MGEHMHSLVTVDLVTRWSEWSASFPGRLTPGKGEPVVHWRGGWVGPIARLNAVERRQICKIWGCHSGDYEECRLLGYKNPVPTSQETRYISATETSRLMLCKIRGCHSGDYEECRLLGYKNLVPTSQETQYLSATETSRLMLCKIWRFHGSDFEECRLLDCVAL
jgi:hypothetical protein